MPDTNAELIRGLYEAFARGDVESVLALMDPQVLWNEAEGFPYADGNPYIGPSAVVEGVFARLGSEWEGWSVAVEEIIPAQGGVVLMRGRYHARNRSTGTELDAQVAHVWWLEGGKITRFQQYTDTAQARDAVGG